MTLPATLESITIDAPGHRSGKVRESWAVGASRRLIVTTDRISALDRVLGTVPHKGQVLNQLAAWWFERTADIVANHVLDLPDPNALLAVDASPLPVEVVVRGRLTGSTSTSLLPRYQAGERMLYGHQLPDGLHPHGALPAPLITPTTKAADGGHDEPVTSTEVVQGGLVDAELWARIEDTALALFARGEKLAAEAGFVLADTKYEFGLDPDGSLLLIDEVHTPDSSRYWDASGLDELIASGATPQGYDKEPVRLALAAAGYRGDGPPPALSDAVRAETSERYITLFERLTGAAFEPGETPAAARIIRNVSALVPAVPAAPTTDRAADNQGATDR
ncbi:MAG: phosphoribosylaminoimidazolesuccinocarboxamide synthase [Actinomycetota bacterium]